MSAPTTVGTIATQTHAPLDVVALQTATAFEDLDSTATKSYSFSGLPTGLSGNTTTGDITGTPSVAGDFSVTITCTSSDGGSNSRTFTWSIIGVPSAAQNYYVNGTTGNDAWTGLSATFTSGTTGPWRTISRANNVAAHASGHVDINVAPGTYRNQVYIPQNSGTDDTHRIRLRVTSDGIVEWLGPATGRIARAMLIGDGWDLSGSSYTIDYISVLRTSETQYFRWDGEVVFGTGGGECAKGSDVTLFGHLDRVGHFNGIGIVIEGAARRTVGWDGISVGPDIDQFVARIDWEQHGTSHDAEGVDSGDTCWIDQTTPVGA